MAGEWTVGSKPRRTGWCVSLIARAAPKGRVKIAVHDKRPVYEAEDSPAEGKERETGLRLSNLECKQICLKQIHLCLLPLHSSP